ncbi:hypothetical protein B0J11DRAFT_178239 [Dendryphion nanum]|uniref:Uncharacterized protein n=1 Tax=Dendryphion nanum TaxID=256645 RepID=A0A9P9IWD1_9PLEO|nr:hypothetical protein B0J11DRAFT_178239 [Dendryphion nanum]
MSRGVISLSTYRTAACVCHMGTNGLVVGAGWNCGSRFGLACLMCFMCFAAILWILFICFGSTEGSWLGRPPPLPSCHGSGLTLFSNHIPPFISPFCFCHRPFLFM